MSSALDAYLIKLLDPQRRTELTPAKGLSERSNRLARVGAGERKPIPAAQYVRMSTEQQQYSLAYQRNVIAEYAKRLDFQIVKSYEDAGKSGLSLTNRPGLKALLNDVVSPDRVFRAVLVYDVSRWGRFQDADEAAHYEFLCKQSGIAVHYCAEPFINDGTLPNAILKNLKRCMAGEYSRELSARIYQSLKCLTERGFWAGSTPGYGYRRMLVGPDGKPVRPLGDGEWKSPHFGQVKLVFGPKHEVETVRSIYRMLIDEGLNLTQITAKLRHSWPAGQEQPPSYAVVRTVLTHPKYAGVAVWGRTEIKLRGKTRRLAPERWILQPGAYPAIVDINTFLRAQQIYRSTIHERVRRLSEQELLDRLRMLWRETGHLNYESIRRTSSTYRSHFGSVQRAFDLVGYKRCNKELYRQRLRTARRSRRMRDQVIRRLKTIFGGRVETGPYKGWVYCPELDVDVSIQICPAAIPTRKWKRWFVSVARRRNHAMTLLCLLNKRNDEIEGYHLLPRLRFRCNRTLSANSSIFATGSRLRSLHQFYRAVVRAYGLLPQSERNAPEVLEGAPRIAKYLNKSVNTVRGWIRDGTLPAVRKIRPMTALRAELDEWMREQSTEKQRDAASRDSC